MTYASLTLATLDLLPRKSKTHINAATRAINFLITVFISKNWKIIFLFYIFLDIFSIEQKRWERREKMIHIINNFFYWKLMDVYNISKK